MTTEARVIQAFNAGALPHRACRRRYSTTLLSDFCDLGKCACFTRPLDAIFSYAGVLRHWNCGTLFILRIYVSGHRARYLQHGHLIYLFAYGRFVDVRAATWRLRDFTLHGPAFHLQSAGTGGLPPLLLRDVADLMAPVLRAPKTWVGVKYVENRYRLQKAYCQAD